MRLIAGGALVVVALAKATQVRGVEPSIWPFADRLDVVNRERGDHQPRCTAEYAKRVASNVIEAKSAPVRVVTA